MVDPTEHKPSPNPMSGNEAGLSGRPALSLDTFRAVAAEVAEQLGEPIAICRRAETIPGARSLPFANKPLRVAKEDGSEILEIVNPPTQRVAQEGADSTEIHDRVVEALIQTPSGQKLDAYFGISSGTPEQPPEEAARSDALLGEIKRAASSGTGLGDLLKHLSAHTDSSGADQDALRALMRVGKKAKPDAAGGSEV